MSQNNAGMTVALVMYIFTPPNLHHLQKPTRRTKPNTHTYTCTHTHTQAHTCTHTQVFTHQLLSSRCQLSHHLTNVFSQLSVCDLDLAKDIVQLILVFVVKGLLRRFPQLPGRKTWQTIKRFHNRLPEHSLHQRALF